MPIFPEFKKVDLTNAHIINAYTDQYAPYSDFNFLSLWSWDTNSERKFSILHDNLVVKFTDYSTREPFLSFLGTNQANETAWTLIEYSAENGLPTFLSLIPEVTARALEKDFIVTEDQENNDYIFSTEAISEYQGNQYKKKRQLANRFFNAHPHVLAIEELATDETAHVKLFELLRSWRDLKIAEEKDLDLLNEQTAIIRALKAADNEHKLLLSTLRLDERIIAFSIDEILPDGYAISHFLKTNHVYTGVTEYFNQKLAKLLLSKGVTRWNWEQDLGLESLRNAKLGYRPVDHLRKFVVKIKE